MASRSSWTAGEDGTKRIAAAILAALIGSAGLAEDLPTARFGVLAYRGVDAFRSEWSGFQAHLDAELPEWSVELVPVTLDSTRRLLRDGTLHFLITNPGHYIELSRDFSLTPLATRVRPANGGMPVTHFGSVIVTAAGSEVRTLADIAGTTLYAVAPDAFGGYTVAWKTFHDQGIDLANAPASTVFTGFPMDQVVGHVLANPNSVGIVRSGLIERMENSGSLAPGALRVLNAGSTFTHPEAVSTGIFPEWPLLATSAAPAGLRLDVMRVALWGGRGNVANSTWTAPLPYDDVRTLLASVAAAEPPAPRLSSQLYLPIILVTGLAGFGIIWLRSMREDEDSDGASVPLTRRQRQILSHVSDGKTSKEIATEIGVSVKTVEFHRTNLLRKFGVSSTDELVSRVGIETPRDIQG